MKRFNFYITGTDTGVGKTAVAALLTRHLLDTGVRVAALKPVCSGGRSDPRALRRALRGALTLDEINPWHFRAPLAPVLAARQEGKKLALAEVLAFVRRIPPKFSVVLVEGAGGLLSPMGEDFDSRDLIEKLNAIPIVVCPNRLGAINQALLVLAALPRRFAGSARIVLVSTGRPGAAERTNPSLLSQLLGHRRIHVMPRLKFPLDYDRALANRAVQKTIKSLAGPLDNR